MTGDEMAKKLLERFTRFGINPGDKYPKLFDALSAMLDVAEKALDKNERLKNLSGLSMLNVWTAQRGVEAHI